VRWADVESDTWVVSPKSIEQLITPRTKVVVVVHLYGMTADMDAILALARKHRLIVVEDCAQAPGARCQGRRVGSIGDFGCFSFQTQKNMSTLGEGGMLTVKDSRAATAARRLRWMGNWPFDGDRKQYWKPAMNNLVVPIPGHWPFNFCMGEPNCAVGRLLLKRLDAINAQRQIQAHHLISRLSEFPELQFQPVRPGREHVYHLMPAYYDGGKFGKHRDDLIELLLKKYNLKCGVNYWPINRSELFEKFGFGKAAIPNSDRFFDNMLSIPWWSDMQEAELDDIAGRIAEALVELREK
jgi:perosamine synthetase